MVAAGDIRAREMRVFSWTIYQSMSDTDQAAISSKLIRYRSGLIPTSESLILFSKYQCICCFNLVENDHFSLMQNGHFLPPLALNLDFTNSSRMKGMENNMVVAVILAGGVGSRLGKDIPKQFVEVLGKPILAYTLEKFENNENIDAIEIVSHKDYVDHCREIVAKYHIQKARWFANGGDSFPESTVNGIFYLKDKLKEGDIVMVHGSCAPLVTDAVINDGIKVCQQYKNAMAIQQMCLSTVLKDDETCSSRPIDRESIVQVQFPLTFEFKYICDMYEKVLDSGEFASLGLHLQYAVYANNETMHFSKGDDRNFKITTQAELDLFEGYLLLLRKRKEEQAYDNL